MTHKDIYTKFMIEYDKANVTSSYPSLTEYEVATVLDKAYNALIAQKITGNNVRRVGLEGDLKSVTDLQPLIITIGYDSNQIISGNNNIMSVNVPSDFLYYIGCNIKKGFNAKDGNKYIGPIDQESENSNTVYRKMPVKLVSHQMAENFKASASNIPWIKNPVCYIEDNSIHILFDSYSRPSTDYCELTYIKSPNKFAKDLSQEGLGLSAADMDKIEKTSYFDYTLKPTTPGITNLKNLYSFECNDTMAEELISLAVSFALENVESTRLNSKLNMRGLEA